MKPTLIRLRRLPIMALMTVVACAFSLLGRNAAAQKSAGKEVTAIEILLEPDKVMFRHAAAANARLLSVYPSGYPLDALHAPHITMVQRFVRTADLDKAYAAAGRVFARENVTGMKLRATGYYYAQDRSIGLASIVIEPTFELIKLQQDLLDAIRVVDQVSGPEKEAYAHDITVLPGHFQCKTRGVVPDLSRTPKQEMIGRSWCNLVMRHSYFPLHFQFAIPVL